MTDGLPADLRAELEGAIERHLIADGVDINHNVKALAHELTHLVAKRLKLIPKPAPAWKPGDVVLDNGQPFFVDDTGKPAQLHPDGSAYPSWVTSDADLIARGGRRVHPARFHDHAVFLRSVADENWNDRNGLSPEAATRLRRIATDMDPDGAP